MGRDIYNFMKAWESRVAANMVAVNPASWLTNFIPLVQGGSQLRRGDLLAGMWDTLRGVREDDGLWDRSVFLTNRRGSDPLALTTIQSISRKASFGMELIDSFTAESLMRGRVRQNMRKGMSEEAAIREADAWTASVMADRSKGALPTIFESRNPLVKLFTQFQVEVNNELRHLTKDIPRETNGRAKLAYTLFKFLIGAWLFNDLYELLIGRRPALDPVSILNEGVGRLTGHNLPHLTDLMRDENPFQTEKSDSIMGALGQTGKDALQQLPFIGGVLGGGRLPVQSALPGKNALKPFARGVDWRYRKDQFWKQWGGFLAYNIAPFGGGQAKKAIDTIIQMRRGGRYKIDEEGNDTLQYPVFNDTAREKISGYSRSLLFGPTSLPTAQDWIRSGFDSFNERETEAYQGMTAAGVPDRDAYQVIRDIDKAETDADKRAVIRDADISGAGKLAAYYAMTKSDKEAAIIEDAAERDLNPGMIVDGLFAMKDESGKAGQAAALAALNLPDEETLELATYIWNTDEGRYKELTEAVQGGMSAADWLRAYSAGSDPNIIQAMQTAGLTDHEAEAVANAMSAYEEPTRAQQYRAVIDNVQSEEGRVAGLLAVAGDQQYRVAAAYSVGVPMESYVAALEIMPDFAADGNGSYKNDEITATLDSMIAKGQIDRAAAAALWQLLKSGSQSAKNNPYSTSIGQSTINAIDAAKGETA